MLKLKTKWFSKWAKKNSLSDRILLKTIENIPNNIGTVNLGQGLYKIRTPRIGQGKSGSLRTIVVFKKSKIAIFVYGFSKSEKDSLGKDELKYFKILAKDLLKIERKKYLELEKLGKFISIKE
jgi:hypothetical protein